MNRNIQWIEDALKQSSDLSDRHSEIHSQAPIVIQNLWDEILVAFNFLIEKAPRFQGCGTNGDSNDRILYKGSSRSDGRRIELHVKLETNREEITAHGENVDVQFRIEKMKDGMVGLTYNGQEEKYEQAAKRILKPFLFPELMAKS
jgi:hypothetical protein